MASALPSASLRPSQTLLLAASSLPDEALPVLRSFLEQGGRLLSCNAAIAAVDALFPGHFTYRHGRSQSDAPVRLRVGEAPYLQGLRHCHDAAALFSVRPHFLSNLTSRMLCASTCALKWLTKCRFFFFLSFALFLHLPFY